MYQTSYRGGLQDLIRSPRATARRWTQGAQRIAYPARSRAREDVEGLAASLLAVKDKLTVCVL